MTCRALQPSDSVCNQMTCPSAQWRASQHGGHGDKCSGALHSPLPLPGQHSGACSPKLAEDPGETGLDRSVNRKSPLDIHTPVPKSCNYLEKVLVGAVQLRILAWGDWSHEVPNQGPWSLGSGGAGGPLELWKEYVTLVSASDAGLSSWPRNRGTTHFLAPGSLFCALDYCSPRGWTQGPITGCQGRRKYTLNPATGPLLGFHWTL